MVLRRKQKAPQRLHGWLPSGYPRRMPSSPIIAAFLIEARSIAELPNRFGSPQLSPQFSLFFAAE
jgi:hypothetical protein